MVRGSRRARQRDWRIRVGDHWSALVAETVMLRVTRKDKLTAELMHVGCWHLLRKTMARARAVSCRTCQTQCCQRSSLANRVIPEMQSSG